MCILGIGTISLNVLLCLYSRDKDIVNGVYCVLSTLGMGTICGMYYELCTLGWGQTITGCTVYSRHEDKVWIVLCTLWFGTRGDL